MSSQDKRTIGLTTNGKSFSETIMKVGWFSQDMDLAKFAMSVAIQKKIGRGDAKGASTIWNVGSFDPDQNVKFVLSEFYNETQEPYRLAEFLIDEGLKIIVERLKANPEMTLLELVGN